MFDFTMTYWVWLIAGLVMLVIELAAPIAFFLWLGVSAIATGAVVALFPDMSWQLQAILFSVLSVISLVTSRRYLKKRLEQSESPNLNRRAEQYIGRTVKLCEPIENGFGKAAIDDSRWQVKGPTLPVGSAVVITGVDGAVFVVEAPKQV